MLDSNLLTNTMATTITMIATNIPVTVPAMTLPEAAGGGGALRGSAVNKKIDVLYS
jgi:hypothetical protein